MKLKNVLLPLLVSASLNMMKAQQVQTDSSAQVVTVLEQNPPTEKETITIDKLYAGMYGVGTFDDQTLETGKIETFNSIRIGGKGTRHISDKFKMRTTLAYDKTGGEDATISTFDLVYAPTKSTTVDIGKIPQSATHMIGAPVTPGGHFLFTAENQVPLTALAAKVTQKIGNTELSGSVGRKVGYDEATLFVSNNSKKLGSLSGAVALNLETNEVEGGLSWITDFTDKSNVFCMVWLDPQALSYSAMRTSKAGPRPLDNVGIFLDGQYNLDDKEVTNTQV